MKKTILGRPIEKGRPERGRFLRRDIHRISAAAWSHFETLFKEREADIYPGIGNRHNVLLAGLTIAVYRSLREVGIQKEYAIELVSDSGWKLYSGFIPILRFVARLMRKDPQQQLNLMLKMLMAFPFSAPGRPGYEVEISEEENRFGTFWTFCPPLHFVREFVGANGDDGELELFRNTWCTYDWAFTSLMMEKSSGAEGHYERPHTLSRGDEVCDMYWYASEPEQGVPG
ncbi:MAG: hypothetical protein R3224_01840 [Balneolaceae bacterium]|nr:hypothetical protein [Balneolaceae bacterium]